MADGGGESQWKGYSAYKEISSQLHKDVSKAVRAYSHVNSKSTQNVGITPQTAVNAKKAMLYICKRLFYEIERNRHVEPYDEIYERWSGNEVADDGEVERTDEAGYIRLLDEADLTREVPSWLGDMMDDLIRASWKLGYIRAGTDKPADPDDTDTQMEEMFE